MTAAGNEAARLRGQPRRLVGVIRRAPRGLSVRCEGLPGSAGPLELRPSVMGGSGGEGSTVRLRVPMATPPGTYEVTLHSSEGDEPLLLEVEPHARTRLLRYAGDVAGPPGSEHRIGVTVINAGNVAFELSRSVTMQLTDADLLGSVLGAVAEGSDSEARLHAFADGLARATGWVELRLDGEVPAVAPGEWRELTAAFEMPHGLEAGRTYVGGWRIGRARFTLRLHPQGPGRDDSTVIRESEGGE